MKRLFFVACLGFFLCGNAPLAQAGFFDFGDEEGSSSVEVDTDIDVRNTARGGSAEGSVDGNFSNNETNVLENIDSRDFKHHAETASRVAAGSFCSGNSATAQTGVVGAGASVTSNVCALLEVARVADELERDDIANEALEAAFAAAKAPSGIIKRLFDRINPFKLIFG